jgi:hypothetical protein
VSTSNLAGDDEVDFTYRRSHCWDVAEDWRMITGPPIPEEDAFELGGESGAEEFIEYRPLDNPLPDSPKETSPVGLSPAPPFRQNPPLSERSQSQSPDGSTSEASQAQSPVGSYEGVYVSYQQRPTRSQSQESNRSNPQETRIERYHPETYHPGAYPESDRHLSYQSQQLQQENAKAQDLPTFEFQQQTEEALHPRQQGNAKAQDLLAVEFQQQAEKTLHPRVPSEVEIPMGLTHTDATFTGIEEQFDRVFSLPLPTGSDHNGDNGRRG